MRTILVAVDENETAVRVGEFVNGFFGDLDVEVLGIHVGRTPTPWMPPVAWGGLYAWRYPYPYTDDPAGLTQASREDAMNDAEEDARRAVLASPLEAAEPVVEFGDPVEAIQHAADARDVDIIVVGSTDKNLLQRLVSTSVSRELVDKSDRPVLVVP